MDLPSLAVVLQAVLSPNPDERKAAEQSLNQVFVRSLLYLPLGGGGGFEFLGIFHCFFLFTFLNWVFI